MTKAIAITKPTAFKATIDSAVNSAVFMADFMYGTKQRADYTICFALGLVVLGMALQHTTNTVLPYCLNG